MTFLRTDGNLRSRKSESAVRRITVCIYWDDYIYIEIIDHSNIEPHCQTENLAKWSLQLSRERRSSSDPVPPHDLLPHPSGEMYLRSKYPRLDVIMGRTDDKDED